MLGRAVLLTSKKRIQILVHARSSGSGGYYRKLFYPRFVSIVRQRDEAWASLNGDGEEGFLCWSEVNTLPISETSNIGHLAAERPPFRRFLSNHQTSKMQSN